MITFSVHRQDGSLIDPQETDATVFYDETVQIRLETQRICEMHLYFTVVGSLQDRELDHSVAIFDGNLTKGKSWAENVHVRHPLTPLQNPHMEISITAKYDANEETEEAEEENTEAEVTVQSIERLNPVLEPFHPVTTNKPSFLAPFTPLDKPEYNTKQSERPLGLFKFAEVYEERRDSIQSHSELVSTNPKSQKKLRYAENNGGIEVYRWRVSLIQAVELEIRFLRPALERDRIIAQIDVLAGAYPVEIRECTVELDDGVASLMGASVLPVNIERSGKYAMCFNLELRAAHQSSVLPASRKNLSITLKCEVYTQNGANTPIKTTWVPVVDFESAQGPLPKTPAIHIHPHSPMGGSNFNNGRSVVGASASDSNISSAGFNGGYFTNFGGPLGSPLHNSSSTLDLVGSRKSSNVNLSLMGGVSIIITGPQFVKVGEVFTWHFKVMNRSQRNRMFTMTFGDSNKDLSRVEAPMPSDVLQAYSNYDAEQLRLRAAAYYRSTGSNRGIVPLCHELKIGNLAPKVCFETKIELQALKAGTYTIESSRIEDLSARDSYNVGGLLEVIVEP